MAAQMTEAFRRGAKIIPVIQTGGAAAGQFNFPQAALEKPPFATEEQWSALRDEAEAASIESTAEAVVAMVEEVLREFQGCGRSVEDPRFRSEYVSLKM